MLTSVFHSYFTAVSLSEEKASHGIITSCSCLLYDSFQYSNEVAASGLKAKKSDDAQVFKACATKKQTLLLNYMRWSNFDFRDSLLLLLSHQDFIIHSVTRLVNLSTKKKRKSSKTTTGWIIDIILDIWIFCFNSHNLKKWK